MASDEPFLPRVRLPTKTFALPAKRAPTHNVGIYSQHGETYHEHGKVLLHINRKPLSHQGEADKDDDDDDDNVGAVRASNALRNGAAAPSGHIGVPSYKRDLGLGVGLQPQRFPRELLKSSERRLISCHAGTGSVASSSPSLRGSASVPILAHAGANASPARPRRPTDPVRQLFSLTTPEEGAHRVRVGGGANGVAAAAKPPRRQQQPPAQQQQQPAKQRFTAAPTATTESSPRMGADEGGAAFEGHDSFAGALRRLNVGPRAKAEFASVQRDSRLRLNEALAERQRLRDSVFSLPHAHVGLTPMVLGKSRLTRSQSSSTVVQQDGHAPAEAAAALRSHHTPGRSGSHGHMPPRQASSRKSLTQQKAAPTPASKYSPSAPTASHPLGKLGKGTFWHDATNHISVHDGGALKLYQAIREKAEQPRKAPPSLEPAECASLVDSFFRHLCRLLEEMPKFHMAVSAETVEELFSHSSDVMMHTEGAREVLLPLLRVAAEHVHVSSDEARRLQLQYAYPPEVESPPKGSPPRKGSLGSPQRPGAVDPGVLLRTPPGKA